MSLVSPVAGDDVVCVQTSFFLAWSVAVRNIWHAPWLNLSLVWSLMQHTETESTV